MFFFEETYRATTGCFGPAFHKKSGASLLRISISFFPTSGDTHTHGGGTHTHTPSHDCSGDGNPSEDLQLPLAAAVRNKQAAAHNKRDEGGNSHGDTKVLLQL